MDILTLQALTKSCYYFHTIAEYTVHLDSPFHIVNTCPLHDDIIKWKHFPHHWPFVQGIQWSPVNSPHKDHWRGALLLSLICSWTNGCANNWDASDLRHHCPHYDVTVMRSYGYSDTSSIDKNLLLFPYHSRVYRPFRFTFPHSKQLKIPKGWFGNPEARVNP